MGRASNKGRRRYRVASEGRSVAPRWPRVVARLHRSVCFIQTRVGWKNSAIF